MSEAPKKTALVLRVLKAMRAERRGGLSPMARWVLVVLADFDLEAISIETICDAVGAWDKAVRGALDELEGAGWVHPFAERHRTDPPGQRRPWKPGRRKAYVIDRERVEARAEAYLSAVHGTAVNTTAVEVTAVNNTEPAQSNSPGTPVKFTGDRGQIDRRKSPVPLEVPRGPDLATDVAVPRRAAKRVPKRTKSEKPKAPPHADFQRVVDHYTVAYERRHGSKPTDDYAFIGRKANELLAKVKTGDVAIRRIDHALAETWRTWTIRDVAANPDRFVAAPLVRARPSVQPAAAAGESAWEAREL